MKVLLVAVFVAVFCCSFVIGQKKKKDDGEGDWKVVIRACQRYSESLKNKPEKCFKARFFIFPTLCDFSCVNGKLKTTNCKGASWRDTEYAPCRELTCVEANKGSESESKLTKNTKKDESVESSEETTETEESEEISIESKKGTWTSPCSINEENKL